MLEEIINHIIMQRVDICAWLHTGFGKSLCYAFAPVFYDKVHKIQKCSVILCPLRSIVDEQISCFLKNDIRAVKLRYIVYIYSLYHFFRLLNHEIEDSTEFNYLQDVKTAHVLFVTPDIVHDLNIQNQFRYINQYNEILVFAIDEAHTVLSWAHSIRENMSICHV